MRPPPGSRAARAGGRTPRPTDEAWVRTDLRTSPLSDASRGDRRPEDQQQGDRQGGEHRQTGRKPSALLPWLGKRILPMVPLTIGRHRFVAHLSQRAPVAVRAISLLRSGECHEAPA